MNTLVVTINSDNPQFITQFKSHLDEHLTLFEDITNFTSEMTLDVILAKIIDLNVERMKRDLPVIAPYEDEE